MSILINNIARISDNFKTLIKSGNYEKIILNLMNSSKKLFPNTYKHIMNQSHGECDFIDILTSKKFDAKLPFSKKEGKLIGSNNSDFSKWIELMINETNEFGKYIEKRGQYNIENLTLYKTLKNRLENVSLDEDVIFFFPYPIVLDGSEMIFAQFAGDILSSIYNTLKNNDLIKNRTLYAIYPCLDNEIAIRCLNTNIREYFKNSELKDYIDYEFSIAKE